MVLREVPYFDDRFKTAIGPEYYRLVSTIVYNPLPTTIFQKPRMEKPCETQLVILVEPRLFV